jgi:HAD superfamily hydrolase (TIGR01509 family)
MTRFDAVIFDMDGVLIDSEPVIRRAAQLAGEDFGKTLTDELFLKMIGLPGGRVEAMMMEVFGADFPLAEYRLRFQHFYQQTVSRDGMRSKPGVPALLQALTAGGVPIAVATQTRSGHAQAALSAAGLIDYLPVCATGDEVKQGKPAPDVFLLAASRLGVDPARCIALEDSDVGAQAAVSAVAALAAGAGAVVLRWRGAVDGERNQPGVLAAVTAVTAVTAKGGTFGVPTVATGAARAAITEGTIGAGGEAGAALAFDARVTAVAGIATRLIDVECGEARLPVAAVTAEPATTRIAAIGAVALGSIGTGGPALRSGRTAVTSVAAAAAGTAVGACLSDVGLARGIQAVVAVAAVGAVTGHATGSAVAAVAVGATARDPAAGTGCTTGATCPAVTGVAAGTAGRTGNTRSGTRRACHAIATVAAESSGTTGAAVTTLGVSTCRKTGAAGSALAAGSTLATGSTVGSGRARVTGLRAIGTVVACRSGSAAAALTG